MGVKVFCQTRWFRRERTFLQFLPNYPNRPIFLLSKMLSSCQPEEILKPYHPPQWLTGVKGIPSHTVQLAQVETPIHRWNLPGVPDDFQVFIKRDDMTGGTLSGNKVRKLEFLLADAVAKGCRHLITTGGLQSNHCRAVAIAARQLGFTPHLFLQTNTTDPSEIGCDGNLLLDRMTDSNIYLIPSKTPYKTHRKPRMEKLAQHIKLNSGEESYLMEVGGSDEVGIFGYIEAFREMMEQGVLENFDDIVCACGSGSTTAGLAVGNYLTGSKLRVHGITVCDSKEYFHQHNNEIFPLIGLETVKSEDIMNIIDGFKGKGYGLSTDEELEFIAKVGRTTGIMLDPVYTGKTAFGLMKLLQKMADIFKGKRILFVHTGGVFGLADGRMNRILKQNSTDTDKILVWPDININPF